MDFIILYVHGSVTQWLECHSYKVKVVGSSPTWTTNFEGMIMKHNTPYTKDFKKFVEYLVDWMDNSTASRDMIYEVAMGDLTYTEFLEAYDPEAMSYSKDYVKMYYTLKYFGSAKTKRACKLANKQYDIDCGAIYG